MQATTLIAAAEIPPKLIFWAIVLVFWAIKSAINLGKKPAAPAPLQPPSELPSLDVVNPLESMNVNPRLMAPLPVLPVHAAPPPRVAPAERKKAVKKQAVPISVATAAPISRPAASPAKPAVAPTMQTRTAKQKSPLPVISAESLRQQWILTEVLGKPLALRE